MSPQLSSIGHKPRTNAQRLRHAAYCRARRAAITRDLDFEIFCADAGVNPSPQSCLSPVIWDRVTSLWDGLNLEQIPGRAADYPNGRFFIKHRG